MNVARGTMQKYTQNKLNIEEETRNGGRRKGIRRTSKGIRKRKRQRREGTRKGAGGEGQGRGKRRWYKRENSFQLGAVGV